jgi:hypothetical protein
MPDAYLIPGVDSSCKRFHGSKMNAAGVSHFAGFLCKALEMHHVAANTGRDRGNENKSKVTAKMGKEPPHQRYRQENRGQSNDQFLRSSIAGKFTHRYTIPRRVLDIDPQESGEGAEEG